MASGLLVRGEIDGSEILGMRSKAKFCGENGSEQCCESLRGEQDLETPEHWEMKPRLERVLTLGY